jgi:hypothetical protein
MTRRVALALFAALALLAVPTAAGAQAHATATGGHHATGFALAHGHAGVVHVVVAPRRGHERRAPDQSGSSLAVVGGSVDLAPACARAHLSSAASSPAGELQSSRRPRAPPAVV